MTYASALALLKKNGQEQVLAFWPQLSAAQRKALLAQIATFDFKVLARMETLIKAPAATPVKKAAASAPDVAELKGAASSKAVAAGEKELRAGRVGVLLVAGGQGSRLGFNGPKGAFPIGPVTGEPLFYFHARKVLALSIRYGHPIPFYIMTSEANNEATQKCFEEHEFFGLNPDDVIFFTQGMWPGMTSDGKIILDAPGHVFMSPDGHGGTLAALKRSGALADMKTRGVKSVFFFQVDNPMVEIADPAFIGYHVLNRSEYSCKLCAKRTPDEKVGMVVRRGDRFEMIEYTELTPGMANRRRPNGKLYFLYGSVAIHVFDRAFLEREAVAAMPLHLAHKKIPFVDEKGRVVKPAEPNGYKFEKFIFDILADAKRAAFMAFDRAEEFSPVKNAEGIDSPASCKADLQAKWARWLAAAGLKPEKGFGSPIEIDPAYALDAAELKRVGLCLQAED